MIIKKIPLKKDWNAPYWFSSNGGHIRKKGRKLSEMEREKARIVLQCDEPIFL